MRVRYKWGRMEFSLFVFYVWERGLQSEAAARRPSSGPDSGPGNMSPRSGTRAFYLLNLAYLVFADTLDVNVTVCAFSGP